MSCDPWGSVAEPEIELEVRWPERRLRNLGKSKAYNSAPR